VKRKDLLQNLIALPALAGLLAASTAPASAKGSKSQFKYQDHPNGAEECAKCNQFIPSATEGAPGSCKVGAGAISPNGWCTAFLAKA
jgi:hypothetical protein